MSLGFWCMSAASSIRSKLTSLGTHFTEAVVGLVNTSRGTKFPVRLVIYLSPAVFFNEGLAFFCVQVCRDPNTVLYWLHVRFYELLQ